MMLSSQKNLCLFFFFLLLVPIFCLRIKHGLSFKALQEKFSLNELEQMKFLIKFAKTNDIIELITEKEGNITLKEIIHEKKIGNDYYNTTELSNSINKLINLTLIPIKKDIYHLSEDIKSIKDRIIQTDFQAVQQNLIANFTVKNDKKKKQTKNKTNIISSPLLRLTKDFNSIDLDDSF